MIAEIVNISRADLYNDVKQSFIGKKVDLTIWSKHKGGGYWSGPFLLRQKVSFKSEDFKAIITYNKGEIIYFASVRLKWNL